MIEVFVGTTFPVLGEDDYPPPYGRYDTMMISFAEYVRGEKQNPFTYEYERKLHKVILKACGEKVDD